MICRERFLFASLAFEAKNEITEHVLLSGAGKRLRYLLLLPNTTFLEADTTVLCTFSSILDMVLGWRPYLFGYLQRLQPDVAFLFEECIDLNQFLLNL